MVEGKVMASEPRHYLAYLLRMWHVTDNNGAPAWRASLEDVHTGARQGFASLDQLLAFLLAETAPVPSPSPGHPPPISG